MKKMKSSKKKSLQRNVRRNMHSVVTKRLILVGTLLLVLVSLTMYKLTTQKQPAITNQDGAQMGDSVLYLYKVSLENGTIIDTNLKEAAESLGVTLSEERLRPQNITLGKGEVPPSVEQAFLGMVVGDKKKTIIPVSEAFGERKEDLVRWVPRVVENDRTVKIRRYIQIPSREFYESYGSETLTGLVINSSETGVKYAFLKEDETAITFEILVDLNSNVTVPGTVWPSVVYIKDAEYIYALQEIKEGEIYSTPTGIIMIMDVTADKFTTQLVVEPGDGVSSSSIKGTVTQINKTHMKIDANHPYAGQTLLIELMRLG
jgi:FKBP-type peptidyl-prolyl cis-trans isomerase 2